MKITVVKAYHSTKHTVRLQQAQQRFTLDYEGTEAECEWYAAMFKIALEKHDKEKKEKR